MKIQVTRGTWSETCTTENSLMDNALVYPEINDTLQYAEQRNLITYIVSGAKYGPDTAPRDTRIQSKIGTIPKDGLVGSSAYKYRLMGRIQRPSKIVTQVGTSKPGGYFQLAMEDNLLYPGGIVNFGGPRHEAQVKSAERGAMGNYVYTFKTTSGEQFDWSTWVAPMREKQVMLNYTAYGEKSIRGYSRTFYPDMFVQHTTLQRKTCGISGSVNVNVLWVQPEGQPKGWYYEVIAQMNKVLTLEDEFQKMWGRTNMINADGTVKDRSDDIDEEGGFPIIRGSGIWEQIEGINDSWTSGINGRATYDDYRDMLNRLRDHTDGLEGNVWYAFTGKGGMSNAYDVLEEKSRGYLLTQNQNSSTAAGGPNVPVGFNFNTLNVDGNQVIFVEHPMMSDRARWSDEAVDGTGIMEGSYIFVNASEVANTGGQRNIEILGRGAYGVNRTMITGHLKGMTGMYKKMGLPMVTSVDADEYHTLKEDMLVIYNTKCCGILHRSRQ